MCTANRVGEAETRRPYGACRRVFTVVALLALGGSDMDPAGEDRTSYTRVGAAFPHKKGCGFNIEITEGISVSGQLVALPPRPRQTASSPLI